MLKSKRCVEVKLGCFGTSSNLICNLINELNNSCHGWEYVLCVKVNIVVSFFKEHGSSILSGVKL